MRAVMMTPHVTIVLLKGSARRRCAHPWRSPPAGSLQRAQHRAPERGERGGNALRPHGAEAEDEAILLTGDAQLKAVALDKGIKAHGVLWAIDQMEEHEVSSVASLHDALHVLLDDVLVFLPDHEIQKRIRRLAHRK